MERTHSWMNRFQRLLIRWEKKAAHDAALPHAACAWIAFRAAAVIVAKPRNSQVVGEALIPAR